MRARLDLLGDLRRHGSAWKMGRIAATPAVMVSRSFGVAR
jgi:hypothetical protein